MRRLANPVSVAALGAWLVSACSTSSGVQPRDGSGQGGGSAGGAAAGQTGSGGSSGTTGTGGGSGGDQVTDGGVTGTGGTGVPDASALPPFKMTFKPMAAGGATMVTDAGANGGSSIGLGAMGQGAEVMGLPAASRLAIHYATTSTGTITVTVGAQPARKVNVHSSGALTGSFLYAIIDISIPAGSSVTISHAANDVAVNIDQVIVGNGSLDLPPDIWNLSPFPVAPGPYTADWKALGLAYIAPQWWRDAKLGAWAHWDPQSMPEQGDWYAYNMYQEGSGDFNFNVSHYGDPSVYGYKDICHDWKIDMWDPASLMDLYIQMGAKFFMAMGDHHDNFDLWDSTYQPWNSVKVGVKKDILDTWAKAAKAKSMRFGIGLHNSPGRTWGQWMPIRYKSDAKGPYDAMQTILDGKGKWWEGMDPADLYGYRHSGDCSNNTCNNSPYGTQFMYRLDDAIVKYHPDVIYFDEHAGDSQVDLGVHMGFGAIAPTIVANYYNRSLAWNPGKTADVVMNMKGVGGQYDSFQNSPTLLPYVQRAQVRSTEASTEPNVSAYPFQTEFDMMGGNWHYKTGAGYTDAASLVTTLMKNVSRNGSLMLNVTQHGRGNLDPQCTQIAQDIGAWLKANGEAVYASRPFDTWGDATVLYTRNNGNVYAVLLSWNGGAVTLPGLRSGGATLGKVTKVEVLGSTVGVTFTQDTTGLRVTPAGSVPALTGITNQTLASSIRVLRITHDKGWFNDDDPTATFPGWMRTISAAGSGDYNNDLTTADTVGLTWTASFTGTQVSVYAPKSSGAGKMEIQIDGTMKAMADLSATGARQPQQMVAQVTGLAAGKHTISIINRGPGSVSIDALVVQ